MLFTNTHHKSPSLSFIGKMNRKSVYILILFAITLWKCELANGDAVNTLANATHAENLQPINTDKHSPNIKNPELSSNFSSDMEELESIMLEYAGDVLNRKKINLMPGVFIEKKDVNKTNEKRSFDRNLLWTIKEFTDTHALRIDLGRAFAGTGRFFFFKGKF